MPRKPRWTNGSFDKGVQEITLLSWKYFMDYVNQELLNYETYVYRGHANNTWKLEPNLDRIIKLPTSAKRSAHLKVFQYSVRGRRGQHPPRLESDNDWWALGQHLGLATPLLDWTESPFVALFFAMYYANLEVSKNCAVFGISQVSTNKHSDAISKDATISEIDGRKPTVEFVRPLSDENSRLVNQRGLFTRGPNNVDIETWIKKYYKDPKPGSSEWQLIKINIPKTGRNDCLSYLNRMNINFATLFPDLQGASLHCNVGLHISGY